MIFSRQMSAGSVNKTIIYEVSWSLLSNYEWVDAKRGRLCSVSKNRYRIFLQESHSRVCKRESTKQRVIKFKVQPANKQLWAVNANTLVRELLGTYC